MDHVGSESKIEKANPKRHSPKPKSLSLFLFSPSYLLPELSLVLTLWHLILFWSLDLLSPLAYPIPSLPPTFLLEPKSLALFLSSPSSLLPKPSSILSLDALSSSDHWINHLLWPAPSSLFPLPFLPEPKSLVPIFLLPNLFVVIAILLTLRLVFLFQSLDLASPLASLFSSFSCHISSSPSRSVPKIERHVSLTYVWCS